MVPEYPLVADSSALPYSVVGVWSLFVALLGLHRSGILSVLHSIPLLKMVLRLLCMFAIGLLVVPLEAIDASSVLVFVPMDPVGVMDLVLVSLVVAHMLVVAVQA